METTAFVPDVVMRGMVSRGAVMCPVVWKCAAFEPINLWRFDHGDLSVHGA
jgi:hypothetical protein